MNKEIIMKDLIEINVNSETIANFWIGLKKFPSVFSVEGFSISTIDADRIEMKVVCLLKQQDEKKITPIEPMVTVKPETVVPVILPPAPAPAPAPVVIPEHHVIPGKTGKIGRPKKTVPVVEEPNIVSSEPAPVEEKKVEIVNAPPAPEAKPLPFIPANPTTPVRVNELAKLIKMWCKASGLKIANVTTDLLKEQAYDIVENDSDETIVAGIKEAARLMQG